MNYPVLDDIAKRYNVKILDKTTSPLMSVLGFLLWAATFGKAKKFDKYITTVGNRIYCPNKTMSASTYAHELVHMDQRKRYGTLKFVWLYATKKGRLEIELEAYAMSNAYSAIAYNFKERDIKRSINRQAEALSGPMYMYAASNEDIVKYHLNRSYDSFRLGKPFMVNELLEKDLLDTATKL